MKNGTAFVAFFSLLVAVAVQGQETALKPPVDEPAPIVADTMGWISVHFEKSSQTLVIPVSAQPGLTDDARQYLAANGTPITPIDANLTIITTRTYSVSFQDCSVTLTQKAVNDATEQAVVDGAVFMAANGEAVRQEHNVESDYTVVGPFDLSTLRPDKIVIEPPNTSRPSMMKTGPRLRIAATRAIPNAVTTDGQDLRDAFGLSGPVHEDHKIIFGEREAVATTPSRAPDTVSEIALDFATQEMADRQARAWKAAITACGGRAVSDKLF